MVEKILQLFIGKIDAELLIPVNGEVFKTKNVQNSCIHTTHETINADTMSENRHSIKKFQDT